MEIIINETFDALSVVPTTPLTETRSVSGEAPSTAPQSPENLLPQAAPPLTPTAPPTPAPSDTEQATVSVLGNRRQSAAIIANLQQQDLVTVEAAMDSVRAAYQRGDRQAIEAALLDQAAVLQAVGMTLLKVAGNEKILARIQVFTNLSLRAMDQARKSLSTLASMSAAPKQQTNVQVNVGNPANELIPRPHG